MPIPGRRVALIAAVAAAIGGGIVYSCDDVPITTVTFRIDDPWTFAEPAMPLFIEVRGGAGTGDEEAEKAMVVAAMTRAVTWHGNPRLTADRALAGDPSTRVVMTFDPASGGAEANCEGRIEGGEAEADGALRVLATFCSGTRPLANVEGRLRRAAAEADRTEALIRQVTLDLFRDQRHP